MIGHNLFVISFSLETDKRTALEEGPWHYYQDLMILKQTKPMQTPMEVEFDDITLWVQCHNVSIECMEPRIIERIGGQIGKVEDVDVEESGSCIGKFARVGVTRKIEEPLVKVVPIRCEGVEKETVVLLQYERLPDFYFSCGRIGHIARECHNTKAKLSSPRFEGWLQAGRSFMGSREGGMSSRGGGDDSSRSGNSMMRWMRDRGDRGDGRDESRGEESSMGRENIGRDDQTLKLTQFKENDNSAEVSQDDFMDKAERAEVGRERVEGVGGEGARGVEEQDDQVGLEEVLGNEAGNKEKNVGVFSGEKEG